MKRIAIIGSGFRPTGTAEPPTEIRPWISPDIDVRLVDIAGGVFPDSVEAVKTVDEQYRIAGIRAAQAGYDAIYLNTIGDYGLPELRDDVAIPVIGSGDAAFRAAASIGRFAIVTVWPPSMDFIPERVIDRIGAAGHCIGIFNLTSDEVLGALLAEQNFVTDLRACNRDSLEKLRTIRRQAAIAGADVIVYGCTCMAPAVDALDRECGVSVVEPMSFGYRIAQYCVRHGIRAEAVDFGGVPDWLAKQKGP